MKQRLILIKNNFKSFLSESRKILKSTKEIGENTPDDEKLMLSGRVFEDDVPIKKSLKPPVLTDYTAVNFIRMIDNLPPIKKAPVFNDLSKKTNEETSSQERISIFAQYIDRKNVGGIFESTLKQIIEDLNITEWVARDMRAKAIDYKILEGSGKTLKVNQKKLKEWLK